jgi:two-component system nitrogen regulation response regulator NtrX
MARRILVVDDEPGIRSALGQLLEYEGYDVRTAPNAADGLAEYERFRPHLVFMDIKMAGLDGLEALRQLRERDPSALVVMISGHATIKTAVEATQSGAYDILEKPLDTDRHPRAAPQRARARGPGGRERAAARDDRDPLRDRRQVVRDPRAARPDREGAPDAGARARHRRERHRQGARRRAIHKHSPRKAKPFVEVNCAAIPSSSSRASCSAT